MESLTAGIFGLVKAVVTIRISLLRLGNVSGFNSLKAPTSPADYFLVPLSGKTLYITTIAGFSVVMYSTFLLISGIGQTIESAAP